MSEPPFMPSSAPLTNPKTPDNGSNNGSDKGSTKRSSDGSDNSAIKDQIGVLRQRADDLETKFTTASENGLFKHQNKVSAQQILDPLVKAFSLSWKETLSVEEYARTLESLDKAQLSFDEAVEAAGLRRRLVYIYGLPSAAYLILVLALLSWLIVMPAPTFLSPTSPPEFLDIPEKMLLAGAVGSVLRGIWGIWTDVNKMQYRKVWQTWFLLSPFMGALLGGAVYLAFFVGIVTTTLSTRIPNPGLGFLVAILAGYNWEWAHGVLDKAVHIFSVGDTQSNGNKKNGTGSPSKSE